MIDSILSLPRFRHAALYLCTYTVHTPYATKVNKKTLMPIADGAVDISRSLFIGIVQALACSPPHDKAMPMQAARG